MKFDWIKKIDWKTELKGEFAEIAELIGIDNAIALWTRYAKTSVYFSEEPLNQQMKKYIVEAYEPGKAKELARELGQSERFIYLAVSANGGGKDQLDFFKD